MKETKELRIKNIFFENYKINKKHSEINLVSFTRDCRRHREFSRNNPQTSGGSSKEISLNMNREGKFKSRENILIKFSMPQKSEHNRKIFVGNRLGFF